MFADDTCCMSNWHKFVLFYVFSCIACFSKVQMRKKPSICCIICVQVACVACLKCHNLVLFKCVILVLHIF